MFSELRFATPAEISARSPRKTNECQRILARSSHICKIIFKILQRKSNQIKVNETLKKRNGKKNDSRTHLYVLKRTNLLFILEKHFRLFHEYLIDVRWVIFAILFSQLKFILVDVNLKEYCYYHKSKLLHSFSFYLPNIPIFLRYFVFKNRSLTISPNRPSCWILGDAN